PGPRRLEGHGKPAPRARRSDAPRRGSSKRALTAAYVGPSGASSDDAVEDARLVCVAPAVVRTGFSSSWGALAAPLAASAPGPPLLAALGSSLRSLRTPTELPDDVIARCYMCSRPCPTTKSSSDSKCMRSS